MDLKPKKDWTTKEALAYGMMKGQEWRVKHSKPKNKDYSTPTWKKWLSKIPPVGWIFIVIIILILYGYLTSLM